MTTPPASSDSGLLAWAVVANVAEEIPFGPGGLEIRRGTKHFSAGTKVWVLPPIWGDGGEMIYVIGRHRGRRAGSIRIVIARRYLTNFRVRGVYSPSVLATLTKPWPGSDVPARLWPSREEAERAVEEWSRPQLRAQVLDTSGPPPFWWVPDPPPPIMRVNETDYHLAHFNAHRAVYSPHPPPVERGE